MKNNYRIILYRVETEEGEEWVARIPEVNNVGGGGTTAQEAVQDVFDNLEYELEYLKESGQSIPKEYDENYSGKLSLRLPKSLHRKISELASTEGVSLNQFIISQLSQSVGGYMAVQQFTKEIYSTGYAKCAHDMMEQAAKNMSLSIWDDSIIDDVSYQKSIQMDKNEYGRRNEKIYLRSEIKSPANLWLTNK